MKFFAMASLLLLTSYAHGQAFASVSGSFQITNDWARYTPSGDNYGTTFTSGEIGVAPVNALDGGSSWFKSHFSPSEFFLDLQTMSSYFSLEEWGSSDFRRGTFGGVLQVANAGSYEITATVDGSAAYGPALVRWQGSALDETLQADASGMATRSFVAWLNPGLLSFSGSTRTYAVGDNLSGQSIHRVRLSVRSVPEPASLIVLSGASVVLALRRRPVS